MHAKWMKLAQTLSPEEWLSVSGHLKNQYECVVCFVLKDCLQCIFYEFLYFSAGENILHIAIVNEDPAMVKFLLDLDSDAIIKHERAYGVFFSCDDQVASRKDQPATELLKMTPNTNYKGRELTLHFSVSS